MKDYRDMADNVLRRRDKYIIERRKQMKKVTSVLSCFCLVALLGVGVWRGGLLQGNKTDQDLQSGTFIGDVADEVKRPQHSAIEDYLADKEEIGDNSESSEASTTTDVPVTNNPGDTGALISYDEVWGGSYMDGQGRWVIWLTEDTPKNRQIVFDLNPTISEDSTIFRTASYSYAYLTDLMANISKAMGANELPFVSTAALREEINRVVVTVTTEDVSSIEQVLAFDSIGGAIEINNNSDSSVNRQQIKDLIEVMP